MTEELQPAELPKRKRKAGVDFRKRFLRALADVAEHPDSSPDQIYRAATAGAKLLKSRAPLKARNRAAKARLKEQLGD